MSWAQESDLKARHNHIQATEDHMFHLYLTEQQLKCLLGLQ